MTVQRLTRLRACPAAGLSSNCWSLSWPTPTPLGASSVDVTSERTHGRRQLVARDTIARAKADAKLFDQAVADLRAGLPASPSSPSAPRWLRSWETSCSSRVARTPSLVELVKSARTYA